MLPKVAAGTAEGGHLCADIPGRWQVVRKTGELVSAADGCDWNGLIQQINEGTGSFLDVLNRGPGDSSTWTCYSVKQRQASSVRGFEQGRFSDDARRQGESGAAISRRKGTPLEDDRRPWESMGISRAWWYRKTSTRLKTKGEKD